MVDDPIYMAEQLRPGTPVRYIGHLQRTGPGHNAEGKVVQPLPFRDLVRVGFGEFCTECGSPIVYNLHPNYLEAIDHE